MHSLRRVAAPWAETVESCRPGADLHNATRAVDILDDQRRQLREQDDGKISNARAVTITDRCL
jgi:hypothetical protein